MMISQFKSNHCIPLMAFIFFFNTFVCFKVFSAQPHEFNLSKKAGRIFWLCDEGIFNIYLTKNNCLSSSRHPEHSEGSPARIPVLNSEIPQHCVRDDMVSEQTVTKKEPNKIRTLLKNTPIPSVKALNEHLVSFFLVVVLHVIIQYFLIQKRVFRRALSLWSRWM